MKRPNKFLEKKYISSLVIAAFLILSVLTAYNIKIENETSEAANTEVEETIGGNEDVISSGMNESEENTDEQDAAETSAKVNTEEETVNETSKNISKTRDENDENGKENNSDEDNDDNDENDNEKDNDDESESNENKDDDVKHTAEITETTDYSYDGETKLTWPVMGNIILPYSMDTTIYYTTLDQYACNDGILIGAKEGDEVIAAADGRVVNVSESDRYGKTMTVLIGDYYEVYYSQIDNIEYEIGDDVKEGDVIATVAEPTRAFTLEGAHLFFKMTYKGEAVNPTDYLR